MYNMKRRLITVISGGLLVLGLMPPADGVADLGDISCSSGGSTGSSAPAAAGPVVAAGTGNQVWLVG